MYLTAAKKLGLRPAECLVVEDNPNGIQAAEAAECPVMVVQGVEDVNLASVQAALCRAEGGKP
jgi:beta-phosphoglucomutase-like phosphatase (HAD superfamily)